MPTKLIRRLHDFIKKDKLLRQGLTDTNYYFLAQVSAKLIALLIIPVITRLLSVEQFAAFDLFILGSGFLVVITGLGMDSGVALKIVENKNNPKLLSALLVTSVGIAAAFLLLLWAISLILYATGVKVYSVSLFFINGLFLYTLIYQYTYNIYNFVRWIGNAKTAAIINFTASVLGIIGGFVCLLIFEKNLEYYILGAISGSILGALFSTFNAWKYIKFYSLSAAQFKDLMTLSIPYVPTYLSNYLLQFIDRLIITSSFGLAALGLYALVNRIGQVVLFSLQIISSGFRPVIFSNYQDSEGQSLSRKIYNIFWISTVPVTLVAILFSGLAVRLIGGNQYLEAKVILPYIMVSLLYWGSFYLFGFGFQIKRKTSYVTFITIGVVGLIYVLSFPLIRLSGVLGVAQATFVSTMIGAIAYAYFSERLFSFGYNLKLMLIAMTLNTVILLVIKP